MAIFFISHLHLKFRYLKSNIIEFEKYRLFKPLYANVDYEKATEIILEKAKSNSSFGVSALAVHGLITSTNDPELAEIIDHIDMIVPDGQPVRWALNSFYKLNMKDRVYGPELTLRVLQEANKDSLGVYLYGSTSDTLEKFKLFINTKFPNIIISGIHQDRFREATESEDKEDIDKINTSKAHIVLVGRGCPRQEKWVANHIGKIHSVMMAVGAAFDFHAGTVKQAPKWMQNNGLEWLYRLIQEPKRLWKRYFFTNSMFILLFIKHKFILKKPY